MLNIFESNISFLNDKKKSTRMSNDFRFIGSKHVAYQKEMLRRVGIKKNCHSIVVYRNFDGDHSELGTLESD